MFLLPLAGLAVIVPVLFPNFFLWRCFRGLLGNAVGGRRGAIIGASVQGLLISFLSAMLMPF